jgi:hypothetical protein
MFRVLAFLSKRADIDTDEFIDYYERRHVPLICSLAPAPAVYNRRYIRHDDRLTTDGGTVDFDVVVELAFADRAAFQAWMARLSGPGAGDLVGADEAKFLDRSRTRAYVVEEHVTTR